MQGTYHEWYTDRLNRTMAFRVYGHAGKVLMLFPTSGRGFDEAEHRGFIEVLRLFIDTGLIRVVILDSIDAQPRQTDGKPVVDRACWHKAYDAYLVDELCPFIRQLTGITDKIMVGGCSMGGYHSANFFFRHPEGVDTLIALSGLYDLRSPNEAAPHEPQVHVHSPVGYLKAMDDARTLDAYRNSTIIIACGQGSCEADALADARHLEEILHAKAIPAWVDYWGEDVHHDGVWWRKMMLYYVGKLEEFGVIGTR